MLDSYRSKNRKAPGGEFILDPEVQTEVQTRLERGSGEWFLSFFRKARRQQAVSHRLLEPCCRPSSQAIFLPPF